MSDLEKIEALKSLIRFLCGYYIETENLRFKLLEVQDCRTAFDLAAFNWPVVQGFQNQLNLKKIGAQEKDTDCIADGVKIMLSE